MVHAVLALLWILAPWEASAHAEVFNPAHQRLIRRAPTSKAVAVASPTSKAVAATTAAAGTAAADPNFTPLTKQRYTWPYKGPNHVDTSAGARGPQQGDNICNSVPGKVNSTSLCITSHMNSIDDLCVEHSVASDARSCIWAPPQPNSAIADTEGEEVAWCTKAGYGTRLIPAGALSGVQFVKTPDYIAIAGYLDQTLVNIASGDTGGELDPHGADNRGNPIGSLMYSNAFSGGNNGTMQQIIEWHAFIGSGMFCQKACNPASPNAALLCQHRLDRLGCTTNVPLNYAQINGTFASCQGDDQQFPGIYSTVAANGAATTTLFDQGPENSALPQSLPFTMTVPATSQCSTYTSASLYTDALALGGASATAAAQAAATSAPAGSSNAAVVAAASQSASSKTGDALITRVPTAIIAGAVLFVAAFV